MVTVANVVLNVVVGVESVLGPKSQKTPTKPGGHEQVAMLFDN